jgi:hypothetical protein
MGQRSPWQLTEREKEILLKDEHRMLRWLSHFDYPMSKEDMHNRLPRWPGRTLESLLKQELVEGVECADDREIDGTSEGFRPTQQGRDLVTVLDVMDR